MTEDSWKWWQSRRLRYNISLAATGWAAYGATLAIFMIDGRPMWRDWQGGLSMTLFLGVLFLVLMGVANVCYLIGPALEAWLKPADPGVLGKSAYALGLWGSVALPFAFPAINLALMIGNAR
jgi:hypothetical protein